MSKHTGPAHWRCDQCGKDGGEVNAQETLPDRWISLAVLLGVPQLQSEMAHRVTVHLCDGCGGTWLFTTLTELFPEVANLRALWRRGIGAT